MRVLEIGTGAVGVPVLVCRCSQNLLSQSRGRPQRPKPRQQTSSCVSTPGCIFSSGRLWTGPHGAHAPCSARAVRAQQQLPATATPSRHSATTALYRDETPCPGSVFPFRQVPLMGSGWRSLDGPTPTLCSLLAWPPRLLQPPIDA
jgi:hypothetical protein